MAELNSVRDPVSSPRDRRAYPLIAISAATGVFFLLYHEVFHFTLSQTSILLILAGLSFGVPAVLGYTRYSFWKGTIPGILPWVGYRLGNWLNIPVTEVTLLNLVNAFIIDSTTALPVVAIMYIIGVGLRDRDALSERARPLAIRLAATILLLIAVEVALHMGYLTVAELH